MDVRTAHGGSGSVQPQAADLVLEGGGVKGIALIGAIDGLHRAGYEFRRVGGCSAGALVGAVVAAMTHAGESLDRLTDIARSLDYSRFADRGPVASVLGKIGIGRCNLGVVADAFNVLFKDGMYPGRYLTDWTRGVLSEFGVRTFGDLRLPDDPESDLPDGHRYRLVMVVSDISARRMRRLPWDYPTLGLDPDEQPVASAVRASASIPFVFQPVTMQHGSRSRATLVDGGMLSGFPITIFDRNDGGQPRWPTIGVRLVAPERCVPVARPVKGPLTLGWSLVETMIDARDAMYMADGCNQERTMFADTDQVSGIDFGLDDATQDELYRSGRRAAERFVERWDFDQYRLRCRGANR